MTKLTTAQYNELLGVDDAYKAPERLMRILRDKEAREEMFRAFLEAFDYDVSYDWFTNYFQDEHADRKTQKQDFTPRSVNELVTALVGAKHDGIGDAGATRYEPCAGTGGMTIAQWNSDRMNHSPFDYRPSWYFYVCEELSDRALPFLLFNVMIRGMNAVLVHGDVLSRKAKAVYFVQNDADDHLTFSSLNVLPQTDAVANVGVYMSVEWTDGIMVEPHIESPEMAELGFIKRPSKRGEVSDFTKAFYALCGVEVAEL